MENTTGTTQTKEVRVFGASTRFKGSKTIYMQLEEEKKIKNEDKIN
jgi:hypothetical protein